MRNLVAFSALLILQGCAIHSRAPAASAPVTDSPSEPASEASVETQLEPAQTAAVEEEDDEGDATSDASATGEDGPSGRSRTTAKIELTDEQIAERAKRDPSSLGSLSLGAPAHGSLVNGVPMPRDAMWKLMDPGNAWGTQETVDFIALAIRKVNEKHPGTPSLPLGDISSRNGGHLVPHRSHQAGRDVDINYYLRGDQRWYAHAGAQNIDLPRCWTLVKTFVNETDIDMIFIDTSIQRLLADYAVSAGEDPAWIDSLFQVRGKNWAAKIRHVHGHDTHLHVRFFSPMAQELGRRAERYLPASARPAAIVAKPSTPGHGVAAAHASSSSSQAGAHGHGSAKQAPAAPADVPASTRYVSHRAHNGDVLVNLAKHYGTTVEAIQSANGMKGNALQIGHVYKIPIPAPVAPAHATRHGS